MILLKVIILCTSLELFVQNIQYGYIVSQYTVYDIPLCIIQKLLSIYIKRKKFGILLNILHKWFLIVKIILN
jgi:hypothetical protein